MNVLAFLTLPKFFNVLVTSNLKKDRFKEMDQTARAVKKETAILDGLLDKMRLFEDDGALEKYCLEYFKKKVANKPLRTYFSRKCYEYLLQYPECSKAFQGYSNSEELFLQKLPFIFELVVTIQYLHNHILDEKNDVKLVNHQKIVRNLISSNILRELLFQYIEQELPMHFQGRTEVDLVIRNVRQLLLQVDIGQYLDKQYNHFENWKADLPPIVDPLPFFDDLVLHSIGPTIKKVKTDVSNKAHFVDGYFHRIYLSNVYFFRCMAETIMDLGNYRGAQRDPFLCFSITYGFMLQIINDYADFAYSDSKSEQKHLKTAGKKSTDFFADLYNFNITLPLIYHLRANTARRKIESYLEGGIKKKKILTQYPKQIMQEMIQSGAIDETIFISLELATSAKSFLDSNNPQSDFFANMCDMANDNKFFQVFK